MKYTHKTRYTDYGVDTTTYKTKSTFNLKYFSHLIKLKGNPVTKHRYKSMWFPNKKYTYIKGKLIKIDIVSD